MFFLFISLQSPVSDVDRDKQIAPSYLAPETGLFLRNYASHCTWSWVNEYLIDIIPSNKETKSPNHPEKSVYGAITSVYFIYE